MNHIRTLLVASILLSSIAAVAQTTASLQGIVRDPSGAVVREAEVTLTSAAQGTTQTFKTNRNGLFAFPYLTPGSYKLSVEVAGFKTYERTNLVLETAQTAIADVQLQVGGVQEVVTVSGDRLLLNESDGSVGSLIDRTLVENVPLNGRSLQSLFTLVPGVTLVATGSSPNTTNGTVIVNGQRAQSNQFIVDGTSANISAGSSSAISPNVPNMNALGGTQGMVTVDELQEFRVLTATYSAEYGTSPGGQFLFTTRAGTNALHGSAYEFARNDIFDANDWFNKRLSYPRGTLRQNQYGGTFGGPVVLPRWYNGRDKTFFFAAFEGLNLLTPITQQETVPNACLRSTASAALKPILAAFPSPDPGTDNSLATGNCIIGGPDLTGTPGVGIYTLSASQPAKVYTGAIRLDHNFRPGLTAFVRYAQSPSATTALDSPTSFNNIITEVNTKGVTAGLTWALTKSLADDLRFNWTGLDSQSGEDSVLRGVNLFTNFARSPNNPTDSSVTLDLEPEGGIFTTSQGLAHSTSNQINVIDTLTWTKRSHTFKFGGNVRRLFTTVSPNSYLASAAFYSTSAIQTGVADTLSISSSIQPKVAFYNYGLFVNDDWRVSSRLQAQLGLRWDVDPVPGNASGYSPIAYTGFPSFTTVTALPAGTPLYSTKYTNFAPRVGLAYKLFQAGGQQAVLRLGGGFFYDTNDAQGEQAYYAYPFGNSFFYTSVQYPFTGDQTAPPSPARTVGYPYRSVHVYDPNLRLPVTYSWSAAIEQSLGANSTFSLTYVGNAGRQLSETFYLNKVQNVSTIIYQTNGANSSYNALQAKYQARLVHGLTAFGSYNWSHSIDNTNLEQSTYSTVPVRGNSDGDQRNVLRLGLSYTSPRLQGHPFSALLSEWGTDVNIGVQSGLPFTVRSSYYAVSNQYYQITRANIVAGQSLWIPNRNAPGGWQLNVAAFSAPPANTQGNQGRNTIYGFSSGQADVALRKAFGITEAVKLQFRAEAFNLTNHPNFGNFNSSWSKTTTTLGQGTAMQNVALGGLNSLYQTGGPRSMQFAIKLLF